jgi:uncharacterized protein YqgC (DUF456 family)
VTHGVALLLLAVSGLVGLCLIPLSLPGLWVMALGVIVYGWLTAFRTVGVATIAIVVGLALFGEVVDTWLGFRFARRYGGSRQSGWGALVGGLVGAAIGVPVPIVGSVLGALVGAFGGAALVEYRYSRRARVALGAGWGAVLGRAAAAAAKIALGLVIGVIALFAALRA